MLQQVNWSPDRSYLSDSENEPLEFYLDGLTNSMYLDLLLGYFSSAAINVLSLGFATFLYNGGQIRLVINNILSENDKNAVAQGLKGEINSLPIDLTNLDKIKETLDDYSKHFFECLAWLIAKNRIQIKIIKPKNKLGISHYKSGVFFDTEYCVGFRGSCNFTAYGLLENLEELDAFLEWENSRSSKWIKRQNLFFASIFEEEAKNIDYLSADDICAIIQREFGDKHLNELLIQENELLKRKSEIFNTPRIRKLIQNKTEKISKGLNEPRFPYASGPREYQIQAYENWVKNGYQGIFAMATGTGKTITSLNCLLQEYLKNPEKVYHALILVPTITLVEQWEKEALSFNLTEIYKISSKVDWQGDMGTLISTAKRIPTSFILISTYASFVKEKFQRIIKDLPKDTLFIADEGHNLASLSVTNALENFTIQKRIGLSATPKRIYDIEGTAKMEEFFSDKEPYTYSFPMERAIKEGVLCQYYYYPYIVRLTDNEMAEYAEISVQIAKLSRIAKGNPEKEGIIERLLLKRKRIIHKAENKLPTTIEILKNQFNNNGNLKYTFVYVPEGLTVEITETDDDLTSDSIRLINQYTREIAKINEGILVNQFISGMPDRKDILSQFENGQIDVIASMKCLDEGVDIPRAENALFCSSTGNPRQFIQRRGRILRKHPHKQFATIYDLVIIPDYESITTESETYDFERSLVGKELERVMYFASLSRNPFFTEDTFEDVCNHYNLNIYTIQSELATV